MAAQGLGVGRAGVGVGCPGEGVNVEDDVPLEWYGEGDGVLVAAAPVTSRAMVSAVSVIWK